MLFTKKTQPKRQLTNRTPGRPKQWTYSPKSTHRHKHNTTCYNKGSRDSEPRGRQVVARATDHGLICQQMLSAVSVDPKATDDSWALHHP